MPLYPSKVLQARERAPTSYSSVVFSLDSHLSPSRSWECIRNHGLRMGQSQRMNASASIMVDKSFVPQITSNGILFEGRAQYITLKLSDNENLTMVNIYDARTSNELALMWKQLSEANFDTSHIIIGEDFNHLKETDRKRKARQCFMMRREATS